MKSCTGSHGLGRAYFESTLPLVGFLRITTLE
jgi:hypothetical protein